MTGRAVGTPAGPDHARRRSERATPGAAGRSGPTVLGTLRAAILSVSLIASVAVAACTSTTPIGSARPPSGGSAVPGSVGPGGSGPTPAPTAWPGNAVVGIVGLGAGDSEIAKAVADFSEAVAAEDLVRMRGAAIGLDNLVTGLNQHVDRIAIYPPMAGLVDQYRVAFGALLDGARQLRSAIDAGDAQAIVGATGRITEGMQAYSQVRGPLSSWVEQATAQQRLLVK